MSIWKVYKSIEIEFVREMASDIILCNLVWSHIYIYAVERIHFL